MTNATFDKAFLYFGLACIGFGTVCIASALILSQGLHWQYDFNASTAQQRSEVI